MLHAVIFIVLSILLSPIALAQKRVALVIGNNSYTSGGRLDNAVNDARLVARALEQAKFQSVTARTDLGIAQFRQALREFQNQADGAEVALIYYAGHGIEANGTNWLIPTDATLKQDRDLEYEAIRTDLALQALAGARMRIMVLDACRNNPFGRSWRSSVRSSASGLAQMQTDGVLVLFAAAPGQVASDGAAGAVNSPFAAAFAKRLPEPGLMVHLLGPSVRDDVLAATGNVQRPYVSASISAAPFYLVPAAAPTLSAAPLTQLPKAAPGSGDTTAVAQAWNLVTQSTDIGVLEAFRRQFGAANPFFDKLAEARIAEVRKSEEQKLLAASKGDEGRQTDSPQPAPSLGSTSEQSWDVVPVFYGTDRGREGGPDRVTYNVDRGRRLEFGRAMITIPKNHRVPDLERPWAYNMPFTEIVFPQKVDDPAKHFTLVGLKPLARDELVALVRERLMASADYKDHAIVFVHGFNTSFEAALFRTAQIAYGLKFDGAPFLYSWPSKGAIGFQDYSYDRESTGQAEPYLLEFIEFVTKQAGAKSVSIIAHSMGNQLLLPVLRELKRKMRGPTALSEIILVVPDVDRDNFEFLVKEIAGVSRGITLLVSAADRAMDASRRFWGGVPRAGDVPDSGPVVVDGVDTIDVTAITTDVFAINHSDYARKQAPLVDVRRLIQTGERPPEKRAPTLARVNTDKGVFWRYPGSR